jgi:hypothetical protein
MTALAAAAVWLQPALLATLALRVAAGDADAPWLALGALIAPLVALLAAPRRASGSNPVAATATAAAVTLVLAADFMVAGDAATLLGAAPWLGVALAAALSLLVPLLPGARRVSAPVLAVAAVALLLPLVSVALTTGTAPWTAWSHGGWRPSLTFSETSGWVRDGERFPRPARLTFAEGQRVTTLSPGVFRVVERDAAEPTVREWRLAAGETLTLRPGDELSVEAGARLRFEAGRRVPGAPASGIAWADAPARSPSMLPAAFGALATLVGGALALVPSPRRGPPAVTGPLVLLAATAAAVGWGVYAAATAPDLALGGSLLAPVLTLPMRALGPRTGAPLAVLALGAFVALLLTAAVALRARLADAIGPAPTRWAVAVGLAAALTAAPLDPWRMLALGLGVVGAAYTPSLVAGGRVVGLVGSIVGAAVFVALAALPSLDPAMGSWLEPLARYPALVAMPLGWAVARGLGAVAGNGDPTQPIVR